MYLYKANTIQSTSYTTLPFFHLINVHLHSQQYLVHKLHHSPTCPSIQCTSTQPAVSNPEATPTFQLSLFPMYLYTTSSIQSTNYNNFPPVPLSNVLVHNKQYPIHKLQHPSTCPSFNVTLHSQQYPIHKLNDHSSCTYKKCTSTHPGVSNPQKNHHHTFTYRQCTST
jgi:hypothetical protein